MNLKALKCILTTSVSLLVIACAGSVNNAANYPPLKDSPMKVPVFDTHSDVMYRMHQTPFDLWDAPSYISVSIPAMQQGGVAAQVFALWTHDKNSPGMQGAQDVFHMIDLFKKQEALHGEHIAHATNAREMRAIQQSGRTPIFLFIEGASVIANDLSMLRTYHRLGVRGMTLTWMNNLDWAGSSTDATNPNMGLTDFGRSVIEEMNRLNWVIDLSHVSDQTFFDTLEVTKDPVLVSHSGCRANMSHPRNISDEMLKALAANGGVLCVVAYPGYIDPLWANAWDAAEVTVQPQIDELLKQKGGDKSNPEYRHARRLAIQQAVPEELRTTVKIYVEHIVHAINTAGEDHVGLGSDFDGIWSNVQGLQGAGDWQLVAEELRTRGYSEETIYKVMYGNVERVMRTVMDE